eukprot:7378464-Prymnesium_polylepis.2
MGLRGRGTRILLLHADGARVVYVYAHCVDRTHVGTRQGLACIRVAVGGQHPWAPFAQREWCGCAGCGVACGRFWAAVRWRARAARVCSRAVRRGVSRVGGLVVAFSID